MHFGENQLSRSLIGLSPLPTGHPPGFQPWWVRSSTRSYPRFNLHMGRSLRFGSTACDSERPIQTRFRYGYPTRVNLATYRNSQAHSSKGTRSLHFSPEAEYAPTACRHTVSGAISRPLTGALFTFPSRYLFTIGHQGVFRLRRWSSQIHTGFHGPRATWDPVRGVAMVSPTGVSPSMPRFSNVFGYQSDFLLPAGSAAPAGRSRYPERATPAGYGTRSVWPVPLSLTTTQGIAVAFFSCGY